MVTRDNGYRRLREYCQATGRTMTTDLVRDAGVTYRQVEYWCRTGLLEYEGGEGSGYARTHLPIEIKVAELLGELSRRGLSPSSGLARRAALAVRAGGEEIVNDGPLSIFIS